MDKKFWLWYIPSIVIIMIIGANLGFWYYLGGFVLSLVIGAVSAVRSSDEVNVP